jgi:hypothetical protein
VLKLDNNPWVPPIEDQLVLGVSHVIEYIRTETYKYLYNRHIQVGFFSTGHMRMSFLSLTD